MSLGPSCAVPSISSAARSQLQLLLAVEAPFCSAWREQGWGGTWGRVGGLWVIVQALLCSRRAGPGGRMAVTPVALSGDVFAVVMLVLLVIGGFFCVCDVCFVFRSFRTSEQRGKKIKIS